MDKEKLGDYRVKLKEERLKARKETDVSLQHLVSQAEVWLSLGCKRARHFCPSSMTKPTGEEDHQKWLAAEQVLLRTTVISELQICRTAALQLIGPQE
jgi:hypothetical protein